jgi:hypothetical protein
MSNSTIVQNPAALFAQLFERRDHLPVHNHASRVASFAKLDEVGESVILELIASGRLPNEIAIEYEVPVLHLREWMNKNIDPADLNDARQAAAESFVLKSVLPLTVTFESPGEAAMAKELALRMWEIAGRMDPDRWGNNKAVGAGAPAVTLVFEGVSSDGAPKAIDVTPAAKAPTTIEALKTLDYIVAGDEDE